jgi:hypothetical protein
LASADQSPPGGATTTCGAGYSTTTTAIAAATTSGYLYEPFACAFLESDVTPVQRSLRARLAAHTKWSQHDRVEGTAAARRTFLDRFEAMVDPERVLPEAERRRRAESARKAYFTRLALASSRARQARNAET